MKRLRFLAPLSPLLATLIILVLCGYINNPSAGGGGLSSPVGLADGGTGGAMTAANGGIVFSTASGLDVTTVGTSGQVLKSNGAAVPTWTSAGSAPSTSRHCVKQVAGQGSGASAGVAYFTTVIENNGGTDITYAQSSSVGDTWTINTSGMWSIEFSTYAGDGTEFSITRNSTHQTGSGSNAVAYTERLAIQTAGGTNYADSVSYVGYLTAGDVIRFQGSAAGLTTDAFTFACVQRLN